MPTLGKSPKATAVLYDIQPNEVSVVDVPANGEPFLVVKGMSNQLDSNNIGDQQMGKLDTSQVPRRVMKVVHKRLSRIIDDLNELHEISKNLKVADDGSDKAPASLSSMAKSIAIDIRSLLPEQDMKVEKRGTAESVISLQAITKREDDIEKANAVSYLTRDQWVNVSHSVSEYLTTYVQGVEHDDDGPILIPDTLDSTVEKSADELDELVEKHGDAIESTDIEKNIEKQDMTIQEAFDKIMKVLSETQASTNMEGEGMDNKEPVSESDVIDSAEGSSGDVTPSVESTTEPIAEQSVESTTEPVEKSDSSILAALAAMEKKFDTRFENFEKKLDDVRVVATSASEKVDKALVSRVAPKGTQPTKTTKVKEVEKRDESSFAQILGLSKV